MVLTSESINCSLSGVKEDKAKCVSYHKYYTSQCNKVTIAVNQNNEEICPVSEEVSHIYKTKTDVK